MTPPSSTFPVLPEASQPAQMAETFFLMQKTLHPLVARDQTPLRAVSMLENAPPVKIVLAKRPLQRCKRRLDQRVALPQLSERQVECLLVAVDILIIEIGIF